MKKKHLIKSKISIYKKISQLTRNSGEYCQPDQEYSTKILQLTILNGEELEALPLKLGASEGCLS